MTISINILTGFFEAIVLLMYIDAYTGRRDKYPFYAYITAVFMHTGFVSFSNYVFNFGILNIVLLTAFVCTETFFFIRNIKTSLLISVSSTAIFSITEVLTLFIITAVLDITVEQATIIESYRILGTIFSKMFAFALIKVISMRSKTNRIVAMKTSYWILFFLILGVSVLAISLLYIFRYYSIAPGIYNNLTVGCSFGLLYSTFFSLYLYEKMTKQAEAEKIQEVLQYQYKVQSEHVDEILVTQVEMKKLRHDLRNHAISIQAYLNKGDCKGALEYLERMQEQTVYDKNIIETGNITLDAMLNTKRKIAESKGIQFDLWLQVPENLFIEPIDICIIFGNALDNAIEACERLQDRKRWIKISVCYEKEVLFCTISNSAEKGERLLRQTAKKDKKNHGFGIGNIEAALNKYKSIQVPIQV